MKIHPLFFIICAHSMLCMSGGRDAVQMISRAAMCLRRGHVSVQ